MPNFMLGNNEGPQVVAGADLSEENAYLYRTINLTGIADSKAGIFSAWVRMDLGVDNLTRTFLAAAPVIDRIIISRTDTNLLSVVLRDVNEFTLLDMHTTAAFLVAPAWIHFLAAWDLATPGAAHILIDGISDCVIDTFIDGTVEYTGCTAWGLCIEPAAVADFGLFGSMAEPYFAPGQYLDFSAGANVRKFRGSDGKPMNLGSDGSLPTGVAPVVYQHLNPGDNATDFAVNKGTGGNWSISGTLSLAATSPSD